MSSPPLSFTIPSIHDRTELACRIYHPNPETSSNQKRGAMIAHPYASLGGSYDDPTVLATAYALLREGFVVGTFNFRGAKPSRGQTSWTGKAEVADYTSFIGLFYHYLRQLEGGWPETPMQILLGGYSYGAVILNHLPRVTDIISRFAEPEAHSVEATVVKLASTLAAGSNSNSLSTSIDPSNAHRLPGQNGAVRAMYLFVSPVLGIKKSMLHWGDPPGWKYGIENALVVSGAEDGLTSAKLVANWGQDYEIDVQIQEQSGHFWNEPGALKALQQTIVVWVQKTLGPNVS